MNASAALHHRLFEGLGFDADDAWYDRGPDFVVDQATLDAAGELISGGDEYLSGKGALRVRGIVQHDDRLWVAVSGIGTGAGYEQVDLVEALDRHTYRGRPATRLDHKHERLHFYHNVLVAHNGTQYVLGHRRRRLVRAKSVEAPVSKTKAKRDRRRDRRLAELAADGSPPAPRSIEQCYVGDLEIELPHIELDLEQPRKHFDDDELLGLADSIQRHGLLQPIGVQEWSAHPKATTRGTDYERTFRLIWGQRRYCACEKAGLEKVRCRVYRGLTDAQRLELQIVENDQRADLNPLERAEAYARLNKPVAEGGCGLSLDAIAERLGQAKGEPVSKGYVSGQLKLLQLIPEARQHLLSGLLPVNTAIVLARVAAAGPQAAALKEIVHQDWDWRGHWTAVSLRRAQEIVNDGYVCSLKKATWPLEDATLLPKVGACIGCPFRDAEANACTNVPCFKRKLQAADRRRLAKIDHAGVLKASEAREVLEYAYWRRSNGQRPLVRDRSEYIDLAAACPHDPKKRPWRTVLGEKCPKPLIARHPHDQKKRVVQVATKKDAYAALKKTDHAWAQQAKPTATQKAKSGGYDWQAEQRKRKEQVAARTKVITRLVEELVAAAGDRNSAESGKWWRFLIDRLLGWSNQTEREFVARRRGLTGEPRKALTEFAREADMATLDGLALELLAVDNAGLSEYADRVDRGLFKACELYGIDHKKIVASMKSAKPAKEKDE